MPMRWDELRKVGATARAMLLQAASVELGVPTAALSTRDSTVIHEASGRSLPYAALAVSASDLPLPEPESVTFKSAEQYRLLGSRITNASASDIAQGRPLFGIDVQVPDMVYASYAKCPHIGGWVASANLDEVKALAGVIDAFIIEGQAGPYQFDIRNSTQVSPGVAIVASDTWAAMRARKALEVQWDTQTASADDSEQIAQAAKAAAGLRGEAQIIGSAGDANQALAEASARMKAFYSADFVSHAQLEPQSCVAHVTAQSAEVWTSSQTPCAVSQLLPSLLSLPAEVVTVHSVRGGGGFGRRLSNEYVYEAALIAQRVGLPVKLQWSREDDMAFDYFRSALYLDMEGAYQTTVTSRHGNFTLSRDLPMVRPPIMVAHTGRGTFRKPGCPTMTLPQRYFPQRHRPARGGRLSPTFMRSPSSRSCASWLRLPARITGISCSIYWVRMSGLKTETATR